MARSLEAIEMDFGKAEQQASELEEIASSLESMSDKDLGGTLDELAKDWTGDNAAKYLQKGEALQGNLETTASAIQAVADVIRRIAEEIYEAEMRAWERAHDRDCIVAREQKTDIIIRRKKIWQIKRFG